MNLRRILLGDIQDFQIGEYQNSVVFRKHSERLQKVINYAVSQGYTKPDFYYLEKLDAYLISIEDVLKKLDVFYLFVGDTEKQFKCINICDPFMYEAKPYGQLVWSDTGVQGNGIDAYIDTQFKTALNASSNQNYQRDFASRGFLVKDYSQTWQHHEGIIDSDMGSPFSGNTYKIVPEGNANINTKPDDITWLDPQFFDTGFHTICRLDDIYTEFYLNAQQLQSDRRTSSQLVTTSQVLFKSNIQTGTNTYEEKFSKIGLGFYFMGAKLDIIELELLKEATNEFYVSINLPQPIP